MWILFQDRVLNLISQTFVPGMMKNHEINYSETDDLLKKRLWHDNSSTELRDPSVLHTEQLEQQYLHLCWAHLDFFPAKRNVFWLLWELVILVSMQSGDDWIKVKLNLKWIWSQCNSRCWELRYTVQKGFYLTDMNAWYVFLHPHLLRLLSFSRLVLSWDVCSVWPVNAPEGQRTSAGSCSCCSTLSLGQVWCIGYPAAVDNSFCMGFCPVKQLIYLSLLIFFHLQIFATSTQCYTVSLNVSKHVNVETKAKKQPYGWLIFNLSN